MMYIDDFIFWSKGSGKRIRNTRSGNKICFIPIIRYCIGFKKMPFGDVVAKRIPIMSMQRGVVILARRVIIVSICVGSLTPMTNRGIATSIAKICGFTKIFLGLMYFLSLVITKEPTVQAEILSAIENITEKASASGYSGKTACKIGTPINAQFGKTVARV